MAQQVKIFKKNKVDLDNSNITLTVTDAVATDTGQTFVDFIRNRNNSSAWLTTGSTDAANTELLIEMLDTETVGAILLVGHNFKAYTLQYWDGASYQDFSTAISETLNTEATKEHQFDAVQTSRLKLIIQGTFIVDADKVLKQLIVTEQNFQFSTYPQINDPTHFSNRRINKMLSGKLNIVESVGRFKCSLALSYWSSDADMTGIEAIYFNKVPVLLWLCGGDEDQFKFKRVGYQLEDIYLVRPTNDYVPRWVQGIYTTGIELELNLEEVVD